MTILPILPHPCTLPTLLTFAPPPTSTILSLATYLLHLLVLPNRLYSFPDPSHKPTFFFVDSGCSQGRTLFFLLLICPFPSPYFKISAPIWFIHHITFIFSCLILHFPFHLLQLANIYFFLAGIKQEDFRCQTLNLGQPSSIQGSAAPFYRKFQQWHQKTDRI